MGNLISHTTKKALSAKKKLGLLGNKKNFSETQRLGSEANKLRARDRAEEYASILAGIDPEGKLTTKKIAKALNDRGYRTHRGLSWTPENIRRLLGGVKAVIKDILRCHPAWR